MPLTTTMVQPGRKACKATMRPVGQHHAKQMLHNRFVEVLKDSIQWLVYKDLFLVLQRDTYLSLFQLKSKSEFSGYVENDHAPGKVSSKYLYKKQYMV